MRCELTIIKEAVVEKVICTATTTEKVREAELVVRPPSHTTLKNRKTPINVETKKESEKKIRRKKSKRQSG